MTKFEFITFGLGAVGTVLGITNGLRQIIAARVRLLVKCYPLMILENAGDKSFLCVEVINVGSFPVSIKEVGFRLKEGKSRMTNSLKRTIDGKSLPARVESHDSTQICFSNLEHWREVLANSSEIVVETACGTERRGSLKSWRRMEKQIEQSRLNREAVSEEQQ